MGGRYPNSKRGKIVFEVAEPPSDLNQLLIARLEELAHDLGYEFRPVGLANRIRSSVSTADSHWVREGFTVNLPGVS